MAPEVGAGEGKSHGRDGKGVGFGAHSLSGPAVTLPDHCDSGEEGQG